MRQPRDKDRPFAEGLVPPKSIKDVLTEWEEKHPGLIGGHAQHITRGLTPPRGYISTRNFSPVGIQVNRNPTTFTVAIQFAEDKRPDRLEKDRLEAAGFIYDPASNGRRQWERRGRDDFGGNLADALQLALNMAKKRGHVPVQEWER